MRDIPRNFRTGSRIFACSSVRYKHFRRMNFSLALDHLAVVCRTIEEGASYVEAVLGAKLSPGGSHPNMGTHNALLSLGPKTYLEVIAVDPSAQRPQQRRWFNLDNYAGPPRMMNWICRTDDLYEALDAAPPGSGTAQRMWRGDFAWRMGVTEFGRLPYDDAMPALMQWETGGHPNQRLPDQGFRLTRLDVFHPAAEEMVQAFPALESLDLVSIRTGPEKRLIASISTPDGNRVLA